MFYFTQLCLVAAGLSVLNKLVAWAEIPYEGVVALRGIYFYVVWIVIVMLSNSVHIANDHNYRRVFGTNNKRWTWLFGIYLGYLSYCWSVGWGQPLAQGLSENAVSSYMGLKETDVGSRLERTGELLLRILDNQIPKIAVSVNEKPAEIVEEKKQSAKKRKFHGLVSWTHWMVLIFPFTLTLLLYFFGMWREEIGAWWEKKKNEMDTSHEGKAPSSSHTPPTDGESKVATTGRVVKWMDFGIGIADFILNIVGSRMKR